MSPPNKNNRSAAAAPSRRQDRIYEQLEERILFDAVPDGSLEMLDGITDDPFAPSAESSVDLTVNAATTAAEQSPEHTRNEIVFVDKGVEDYELLVAELAVTNQAEVIFLDQTADGLAQIADALADRNEIDAIHIISHGDQGQLRLGNATLTADSITGKHAAELADIRNALSENADLLIYGCNFGEGEAGRDAVSALSLATGADIAASNDLTGSKESGGDWDLEVAIGVIETQFFQISTYRGSLGTIISLSDDQGTDTADGVGNGDGGPSFDITEFGVDYENIAVGSIDVYVQVDGDASIAAFVSVLFDIDGDLNADFDYMVTSTASPASSIDTFILYHGANDGNAFKISGKATDVATLDPTDALPMTSTVTLGIGSNPFNGDADTSFDMTIDLNEIVNYYNNNLKGPTDPLLTYSDVKLLNVATHTSASPTSTTKDQGLADASAPFAADDDGASTLEDSSVAIDVLANDNRLGYSTVTVSSAPANGTAVPNADGTITYTPNAHFSGTDTFVYEALAIDGLTHNAQVTIAVAPVADMPTIVASDVAGETNTSLSLSGSINNSLIDLDGSESLGDITISGAAASLTFSSSTGSVTNNGGGSWAISQAALAGLSVTGTTAGTFNLTASVTTTDATDLTGDGDTNDANETDTATASDPFVISLTTPQPPTLDLNGAAAGQDYGTTYTEGAPAANIADAAVNLSDLDDLEMSSMALSIGGLLDGDSEVLNIGGVDFSLGTAATQTVTIGGTTFQVVYDGAGAFSITDNGGGNMPIADIQLLLAGATYRNNSNIPSDGDRTIAITVTDPGGSDSTATSTINVDPVNDLPTLDLNGGAAAGSDYATSFTEGSGPVSISDVGPLVADVDDTTMASLTITPGGIVDGANEVLTVTGDGPTTISFPLDGLAGPTQQITIGGVTFDLTYDGTDLTVVGDAGEMPLTDVQALIAAIAYENTDPSPTTGDRTLDFVVNDGDADSNLATSTITVGTDAAAAQWSLTGDPSVDEGGLATYTLSLDNPLLQTGEQASVDLSAGDLDTTSADYASLAAAIGTAIIGRSDLSFDATTGTLTYTSDGAGAMAPLAFSLQAVNDSLIEGPEDFQVTLSNAASATGETISINALASQVVTTINDTQGDGGVADGPIQWSVTGDASVDEGGTSGYTLAMSGALGAGEIATVDLGLSDVDTASSDYTDFVAAVNAAVASYNAGGNPGTLAFNGTTLTFTATADGDSMADLSIDLGIVDDTFVEGPEDFNVALTNPASTTGTNVAVDPGAASLTTTINDTVGDGGPLESVQWNVTGDNTVLEGGAASYAVSLDGQMQSGETAVVTLGITDIGTTPVDYEAIATAVGDAIAAYTGPGAYSYNAGNGELTFTSDGNAADPLVIDLDALIDALVEGPENYEFTLSSPGSTTGAEVTVDPANDTVATTILGDDLDAIWQIDGDVSVDEGGTASYSVTMVNALQAGEVVSVEMGLSNLETGSADYADFNTAVSDAVATYNAGANPGSLSWDGTTLEFTSDGTGTMGALDFSLAIVDDTSVEGPERYNLVLANPASTTGSGTSIDPGADDVLTTIRDTVGDGGVLEAATWSIGVDQIVLEGNTAAYVVSLNGDLQSGQVAEVDISLADLTTTSADYNDLSAVVSAAVTAYNAGANPGSLTWDGTTLSFTSDGSGPMTDIALSLGTVDDVVAEGVEDYLIVLGNPASLTGIAVNVSAANDNVTTTIDDTAGPGINDIQWSITGDDNVDEGNAAGYTISMAAGSIPAPDEDMSITIGLTDLETDSGDYADLMTAVNDAVNAYTGPGTLTFNTGTGVLTYTNTEAVPARMANLSFSLGTIDDTTSEGAERYNIQLTNPSSTTDLTVITVASQAQAVTTINDNDTVQWQITGDTALDEGETASYTVDLAGTLQADETASVQLSLTDIDTNSADYADFVTAVNAAIGARTDVVFDSGSGILTFTGDGNAFTALNMDLVISDDSFVEGPELLRVELANASSTTGVSAEIDAANGAVVTTIRDTLSVGGDLEAATWSVTGDTSVDEGGSATHTVDLDGVMQAGETASVVLSLTDVDTNSSDYQTFLTAVDDALTASGRTDLSFNVTTGELTFTSTGVAMPGFVFTLDATNDNLLEGPQDYRVAISIPNSSTGARVELHGTNFEVVTEIQDTQSDGGPVDGPGQWTITGDSSIDEGESVSYTVSLSEVYGAGEVVSVELDLVDIDTNSSDYGDILAAIQAAADANPDVTFDGVNTLTYTSPADGATMSDLLITLPVTDDAYVEGPEDFSLTLTNAASTTEVAVTVGSASSVTTTIDDTQGPGGSADGPAEWSISGPAAGDEGSIPQYTVGLTGTFGAGEVATVDIALTDIGTNSSDYADYVAAINTAIVAYTGAGSLAFDGTTLTWTADADGDTMTDLVIDLPLTNDGLIEGAEDFSLSLSNPTSSTDANVDLDATASTLTTTINDTQGDGGVADGPGEWSITGPTASDEGTTPQYTVSLSGTFGEGEVVSVDLGLTDISTNSSDYGDLLAAIEAAADANPDVTFDGVNTLTYTSPADGATMTPLVIDLPLTDDGLIEGAEDFSLSLSNPTSSTDANVGLDATASTLTTTINDNDSVEWSITGPTDADEGGTLQYTVALSGSYGAGEVVTVDLGLTDIDTNSSDYGDLLAAIEAAADANPDVTFDPLTGTLTYTAPAAGATMTPLVIDLLLTDDGLIEGAEDFSLSLSNPTSSTDANVGLDATASTTTTTINDTQGDGGVADGPGEWSITGPTDADEGGTLQYTVALSGSYGAGEVVTVDLGLTDIDTNSSDYGDLLAAIEAAADANPDVTFDGVNTLTYTAPADGATMTPLVIDLTLTDDGLIEGPEDFSLGLSNPTSSTDANVGLDATASTTTTTINDTQGDGGVADGPGEWSITGPTDADEGGTLQYTVALSGSYGAGEVVTVDLGLTDIDTNSSDYGDLLAAIEAAADANPNVTFDGVNTLTYTSPADGATMTPLVIDLPLTDDGLIEGAEDFSLSLSNPTSSTDANVGLDAAASTLTTTINDTQGDGGVADGPGEWSITGPTDADEGGTLQYTVALSGSYGAGEVATVDLGLTDIDTSSSDYGDLLAAIQAAADANPDVTFDPLTGTLTYTAPADGATMTPLVIDLPLTDDGLIEGAEDFSLGLSNATSSTDANVGLDAAASTLTITINDTQGDGGVADGPIQWSVTGDASVDEGGTSGYTLAMSGALGAGEIATVDLGLSDVDTASSDYTDFVAAVNAAVSAYNAGGNPGTLAFNGTTLTFTATADGDSMADLSIDLVIVDDTFVEGPEDFNVALTNPASTTGANVAVDPGAASLTTTINDTVGDGGPLESVQWNVTGDNTVLEGGAASYAVSLDGQMQSGETAVVTLGITDIGTTPVDYEAIATAVGDAIAAYTGPGAYSYNAGNGELTFTSDGNAADPLVIDLDALIDALVEGPENYEFTLSSPGSTTGAEVTVDPANDTVATTILGDDLDAIWQIDGDVSVDEGGTASYSVTMVNALQAGEVVSVEMGLSNLETGSADYADFNTAVSDAVATYNAGANPGSLSWDGTTLEFTSDGTGTMGALDFSLAIVDDTSVEGPERYNLVLANPASTTGSGTSIDPGADDVLTTIRDTVGDGGVLEAATWSIGVDQIVLEGNTAAYVVSLNGDLQSGQVAEVDISLADLTTTSADYNDLGAVVSAAVAAYNAGANPGSLTWDGTTLSFTSDGSGPMTDIALSLGTVDDVVAEGVEDYLIVLGNPASLTGIAVNVSAANDNVTTTIDDTAGPGINDIQWSITGDDNVDEGNAAGYTISMAAGSIPAPDEDMSITIGLTDLETDSGDYADLMTAVNDAVNAYTGPGTLTFNTGTGVLTYTNTEAVPARMANLSFSLGTIDDTTSEGAERYNIQLTNPSSTTDLTVITVASQAQAVTTINDNDTVQWQITGDTALDEGETASYTVDLAGTLQADETASVQLSLTDIDTNSADYADFVTAVNAAIGARTDVVFDSGSGILTFTGDGNAFTALNMDLVISDDSFVEGPELLRVELANASSTTGVSAEIDAANGAVVTTIRDTLSVGGDLEAATWSVTGDTSVDEGGSATHTVDLDGVMQAGETASVVLSLTDVDTNSSDYQALLTAVDDALTASGRTDLSFNVTTGELTFTSTGVAMPGFVFTLDATNDNLLEGPQDYRVAISIPNSSTGARVELDGTDFEVVTEIQDTQSDGGPVDGPGQWTITGDSSIDEGESVSYTVSLSEVYGAGEVVSVELDLVDIDTNSSDYGDILAAIQAAADANPDVTFDGVNTLTYTSPADGATMSDLLITLPVTDDAYVEGPEDFSLTLTNAASTTEVAVTVGSASSVTTTIDDTQGPGGSADGPAEWSISGPAAGDEGSIPQYTVGLTGTFGAGEVATVDIALTDIGTNSSDYADYVAAINAAIVAYTGAGSLAFDGTTLTWTADADGDTMTDLVINLPLTNDGLIEGPEDFSLDLTSAGSSTDANVDLDATASTLTTTINDTQGPGGADDGPAEWSITGPTASDEGTAPQYTVSLSGTFGEGEVVSVDLGLTDIDTNSSDYGDLLAAIEAAADANPDVTFDGVNTLTYTAPADGATMTPLVIDLTLTDDGLIEGPEDFSLGLSNPTSSTDANVGLDATASTTTTTINDTQGDGGVADGPGEWSITGPTDADEGGTLQYTVALSGSYGAGEVVTVDLGLTDIDTNSSDYGDLLAAIEAAADANPNVTFDGVNTLTYTSPADGATMTPLVIDLPLTDDGLIEGAEDFSLGLSNPTSSTDANVGLDAAASTLTTTINDTQGDGGVADGPGEWSITGPTDADEGGTLQYTVALSGSYGAGEVVTVDLGLTDIDTNSSDYGDLLAAIEAAADANPDVTFDPLTGTLTYTAPADGATMTPLVIDLPLTDDGLIEGAEDFSLGLSNATSSTGANVGLDAAASTLTITINDTQGDGGVADGPIQWSVTGDTSVDEGGTSGYTLAMSGALGAGEIATVDLGLSDVDTASSDYTDFVAAVNAAVASYNAGGNPGTLAFNGTTLTFTATADGDSMADLSIDLGIVDDTLIEGPEDFNITLANPGSTTGANVAVDPGAASLTTTINDTVGDGGPLESVQWNVTGDNTVLEGGAASYAVSLDGQLQSGETAVVTLGITDIGTTPVDYEAIATAVGDAIAAYTGPGAYSYNAGNGELTFTSDGNAADPLVIDLDALVDALVEGPENYEFTLSSPGSTTGTDVTLDPANDTVATTILGDDLDAIWQIDGDVSVDEGGTASYSVTMVNALQAGEVVSVEMGLSNLETGSADYADFNTAVSDAVAVYNAGANPGSLSWDGTTLEFTSDGTGTMGALDFGLAIVDDTSVEGPERYNLVLANPASTTGSGTSIDPGADDVLTTIRDTVGDGGVLEAATWSIGVDQIVFEGNTAAYVISLNGDLQSGKVAEVDISLADLTTTSADYNDLSAVVSAAVAAYNAGANPGSLTWDGTTLSFTSDGSGPMTDIALSLGTVDDVVAEGVEDYLIVLGNPASLTGIAVNVSAANDNVTTTIDDTAGPGINDIQWSITGDDNVDEGNAAGYTISMAAGSIPAPDEDMSITIGLTDLETDSGDYADLMTAVNDAVNAYTGPGTLTFNTGTGVLTYTNTEAVPARMANLSFSLGTIDDTTSEGAERYNIQLTNPSSTTDLTVITVASQAQAVTTINDNDTVQWQITGDTALDEGETASYTVDLAGTLQADETASVQLSLTDIDTNSADYADFVTAVNAAIGARTDVVFDSGSGILTFTGDGNAFTALNMDLVISDDSFVEGPELLRVELANASSTTGVSAEIDAANGAVVTTIRDTLSVGGDLEAATWSVTGDTSVDEGGSATHTVDLDGVMQAGETASVVLSLTDVDTNSSDYQALLTAVDDALTASGRTDLSFNVTTGELTFTSTGVAMPGFVFTLDATNDNLLEGPQDYRVAISIPNSSTGARVELDGTDFEVVTEIQDTQSDGGPVDGPGQWTITGDSSIDEGESVSYTVSLSEVYGAGEVVSVELDLVDIDTNSSDYGDILAAIQAAADANPDVTFDGVNTLTYTSPADGATMSDLLITLPVTDDAYVEGPEDFSLTLTNAASTTEVAVTVGSASSVTTTIDDTQGPGGSADGPAEWSISGPAAGDEGSIPQYTVGLTGTFGAGEVATVDIALTDIGTNSSDYADYVAAINAAIVAYTGAGSLAFDGTTLTWTADADGDTMTDLVINLPLTNDGLIEGPEDFSLDLTSAGSSTDANVDLDATASTLTTTINDTQGPGGADDGPAEWSITGPTASDEGTAPQYTVSLSGTFGEGEVVSVDLGLTDIDTNSSDYGDLLAAIEAAADANPDVTFDGVNTLTYTAPADGATMTPLVIDLTLTDDGLIEGPEDFSLGLSNPTSSTDANVGIDVTADSVSTTITDNASSDWSIDGSTNVAEGGFASYTISLSSTLQAGNTATVELALGDIDTISSDYGDFVTAVQNAISSRSDLTFDAASGTLTYTGAGQPMEDITLTLPASVDQLIEGDEGYAISLANPGTTTGAPIGISAATATTTIEDREPADPTDPANTAPIANDDLASTLEDITVGGSLTSNDGDPDGDVIAINITPVSSPTSGTLTINPDGTFSYTPNPGFTGTETFVYEITDPAGNTDTATVTITVDADTNGPSNDDPNANLDAGITQKNTPISASVLDNDSDPNAGDTLTVIQINGTAVVDGTPTIISTPSGGTVEINSAGTYTYTPGDDFAGTETFTYTISDGNGGTGTATVVLAVFDNPPQAEDDISITNADTPVSGNVLTNDSDPNPNDELVVTEVNGQPVGAPIATPNGTIEMNPDGTYTFTPNPGFVGNETISYTVCDEGGNCDTAVLTLEVRDTVNPPNDPPIANDDTATVFTDTPVSGSLTSNDSDPNGDPLTINTAPVTAPTNGTVTIHPDGTFTYTPNTGFVGTDNFAYEVCDDSGACSTATVTVDVIVDPTPGTNDSPVANDDAGSGAPGEPISGDLLANDSDPNGDPLTINTTPVTAPTNGTVTINSDGTYVYIPNPGFTGTDSFQYEVCDDSGACSTGTATLTVTPDPEPNGPPIVNDESTSTFQNTPVSGSLTSNDGDPEGGPITIQTTPVSGPSNGTISINSDGTYTYTPNSGFVGTDTVTYEVCDAQGACDTGVLTVTVLVDANGPANDAPDAGDDAGVGTMNDPIAGDLLANDTDPNGDSLTINTIPISAPVNGTLTIHPDGTYEYIPNDDFVGNDSFQYEVCDDSGACVTATVSITVFARPPVATADVFTGPAGDPISGNVLTNDSDPDTNDSLTVNTTPVTPPANGTLALNSDGTFTYTPAAGFTGVDSFQYEVCDEVGICDTATVTIANADISASKEVVSVVPNGENFDVTFRVTVKNTGGSQLGDLTLSEDLASQFGAAFVSVSDPVLDASGITGGIAPQLNTGWASNTSLDMLDPGFTGERLNPSESFTLTFTVTVDPDAGGMAQPRDNQVEVTAVDNSTTTPQTITDKSDSGSDPEGTNPTDPGDMGTSDDATPLLIGDAGIAKQVVDIVRDGVGFNLTLEFTFENTGTAALDQLQLHDDLIAQFGEQFGFIVEGPSISSSSASVNPVLNSDWPTDTSQNMFDGLTGELQSGESITVRLVVHVTPDTSGVAELVHQSTGGGRALNLDGTPLTNPDGSPMDPVLDLSDSGSDPNGSNPGAPGDTGTASDPTATRLMFYTYDSYNEFSKGFGGDRYGRHTTEHVILSKQITTLATEPIYSGSARPGTRIVGRIYNSAGSIIAEEMSFADVGGNWMMQMHNVASTDHYRIEFVELVGQSDTFSSYGDIYGYLGIDAHNNDYAALEPMTAYAERYSVGSVFRHSAAQSMQAEHRKNNNPLGFGV